jgi:glycerol-3-phosphate acyltransferase PlsY
MDAAVRIIAAVVAAYLVGSVPWAAIVVRIFWKQDIRTLGSGNVGATNVLRVFGTAPGLAVLALDGAKGAVGVALAGLLVPDGWAAGQADWFRVLGAVAAIAGHAFSPWLGFRGGKGVATAAGAVLIVAPRVWPLMLVTFLVAVALSRIVSVGSLAVAVAFPPVTSLVYPGRWALVAFAVVASLLVVWRHRANIRRIARGEESKITFRRRMWDELKRSTKDRGV